MDKRISQSRCYQGIVIFFCSSFLFAAAGETLIDRIVAHIDGKPVLLSHILRKVDKGPLVAISEYPAKPEDKEFVRALQDSLNTELIMSRSKELNIAVSDEELEKEITRFLGEKHFTREKLIETLRAEGQTYEDYRKDFRDQMILAQFKGRVILPLIKITEKDLETYYFSTSGSLSSSAEVSLRQIFVKVSETFPKEIREQKQTVLVELSSRIKGGLPFEEAVKIYSDDPDSRSGGGIISGVKIKDLASNTRLAVENLKPGEVSAPVAFPEGFRVYQVVGRQIGQDSEYQAKKQQIQYQLQMVELANQTNRWLARERQRASVKMLQD